ncbi:unnamed protein product [Cladocopium goreaui]|uniref:Retinol dehydrogenase 13 n=1 Tax=Cladocopium goreaui TaxID=2562237 RepID=A0A9P1FFJ7_9DINO|nr:unnamed protein product [Cladocopium goreaui]
MGLPRWPAGWHDMLQYHFFFEDMFVQARVFLTPSVEEHSLWIFDHATEKLVELLGPGEVMGNDPRLCFLQLDLSDFDSVKKAAKDSMRNSPRKRKDLSSMLGTSKLDALILNAGALNLEKASTKQGLEATMGVCHFGHFLFTALAWPMLSAEARIVPVSSVGHTWTKKGIDFEDLNWEKRDYDAYEAYFQAKLANVYFTKEIGRRCGAKNLKITAVTLSPGFGRSGLYRDFSGWQDYLTSFISEENEKLSINTMRAATDMTLKNGDYLVPKRFGFYGPPVVTPPSDLSEDVNIAKQLWPSAPSASAALDKEMRHVAVFPLSSGALAPSFEGQNQAGSHLEVSGPRLQILDGPGGGHVSLGKDMKVEFKNKNVFSWLPAGQSTDAVIHRPDLELSMTYGGRTRLGRGYSKRYFGHYGPHWGYRFIQSSWLGDKFLWTADATFRLGDGEAKYNYFKLLDSNGQLTQADSRDTYQQVASITPLGEWLHDYKAGETNSRMQLRYCKLRLSCGDDAPLEGYALNERCFGVLG